MGEDVIKSLSALARDQATNPIYRKQRYPEDDATFDAIADVILTAVLRMSDAQIDQLRAEMLPKNTVTEPEMVTKNREFGLYYNSKHPIRR